MRYNHLFTPIQLNSLTMPNRVMMGSMHVGLEGEENGVEKLIAFYTRRAKEDIGLMITGGVAVNAEGSGGAHFMSIYKESHINHLKRLTESVHQAGGRIGLQLFHAGRYSYKSLTGCHPVAPSAIQAPINPDIPRALTAEEVEKTIQDFAQGAKRAKEAGFDAVEIMGSEGYLINQFISPVTNHRTDEWGGSFDKRIRFAIEIAKAVRQAVGPDYPVIFRMSGIDLIENSTTEEETLELARQLEKTKVDALNVGIGWHESKVPTISMKVPRMKFVPIATKIKEVVTIPVVASNRINNPEDANQILKDNKADIISMARPFLADPALLTKAKAEKEDHINTCIACNQACLDHIFSGLSATCLVNPEAGRETELTLTEAEIKKQILIIGAGPAGLEVARTAAARGHSVTLVDEKDTIGGQINYAKLVPGKDEFYEMLRYYEVELKSLGVTFKLGHRVEANDPILEKMDEIVVATGIIPRTPEIPGLLDSNYMSYKEVFEGRTPNGKNVIIIGGGGIACDLSFYLLGKDDYQITMLQRSKSFAKGIGKTTRWATLMGLKQKGVKTIGEVQYNKIENQTLHLTINGQDQTIEADTFILASGQLPNESLYHQLKEAHSNVHLIGGAKLALGLDAKKAIYEGTLLGRSF